MRKSLQTFFHFILILKRKNNTKKYQFEKNKYKRKNSCQLGIPVLRKTGYQKLQKSSQKKTYKKNQVLNETLIVMSIVIKRSQDFTEVQNEGEGILKDFELNFFSSDKKEETKFLFLGKVFILHFQYSEKLQNDIKKYQIETFFDL